MEVSLDSGRLLLVFDGAGAVRTFVTEAVDQDGFLLPLPEPVERGAELTAHLEAPGFEMALAVTALHVFGELDDPASPTGKAHSTAFRLTGWNLAAEIELRRKVEAAELGETDQERQGETLGASPIFRIQKLRPPEKARLALKANRTERQILLRETSPQIMMALLNNPHVEAEEVLQMVKSPYAPGGVLKRVAGDLRWLAKNEIRLALVKNVRTPTPLAIHLLTGLPTGSLQALAKSNEVRDGVKKAALKAYLKRIGR